MPLETVEKLAQLFETFGPWAICSVLFVGIGVLARHIAVLNRAYRLSMEKIHESHRLHIDKIHESHRLALSQLNEKHHTTATEALHDLAELVGASTTAMVEMRNSLERG